MFACNASTFCECMQLEATAFRSIFGNHLVQATAAWWKHQIVNHVDERLFAQEQLQNLLCLRILPAISRERQRNLGLDHKPARSKSLGRRLATSTDYGSDFFSDREGRLPRIRRRGNWPPNYKVVRTGTHSLGWRCHTRLIVRGGIRRTNTGNNNQKSRTA